MKIIVFILVTAIYQLSFCQVGIGTTTPEVSSVLDVYSTSKGVLLPRLTKEQCKAIENPSNGLIVYVIDAYVYWFHINGLSFPFFEGRLWIYTGRFWAEIPVIIKY